MTEISLKLNVRVPDGADPQIFITGVLARLGVAAATGLDNWQPVQSADGSEQIGECHFEVIDEPSDDLEDKTAPTLT